MLQRRFLLPVISLLAFAALCQAQSALLDLPRKSQNAQVSQTIGITEVTVKYSRPLVNGRKVWGGLVPYGEVWRAGANENTVITFSDPVTIEGKPLDKGTYGLFMIPKEDEWTIIFSKTNTAWGAFTYKPDEDVLRVTVKPTASDFHDALLYDFDPITSDSALVTLRWDKLAVPFKVAVNVPQTVEASLDKQFRGIVQYTWVSYDDAANYFLDCESRSASRPQVRRPIYRGRVALRQPDDQVADPCRHGQTRRSQEVLRNGPAKGQCPAVLPVRSPTPARPQTGPGLRHLSRLGQEVSDEPVSPTLGRRASPSEQGTTTKP